MLFMLLCLKSVLSVQGGIRIQEAVNSTYFERISDGERHIRPFNEIPIRGLKLRSIGPDGTPLLFENAMKERTTAFLFK
jgi:hypothetical protein